MQLNALNENDPKEPAMYDLKALVYGAAVGDALGVPFEFQGRNTFRCTHMSSGGVHGMPAGTFSDDTSLLIATCDSIRAYNGKIDTNDMANRFRNWLNNGDYAIDCKVFDVGNATATALNEGRGLTHEQSNGNGSLMRIAPLALTDATDQQITEVSAITPPLYTAPSPTTSNSLFLPTSRIRTAMKSNPLDLFSTRLKQHFGVTSIQKVTLNVYRKR